MRKMAIGTMGTAIGAAVLLAAGCGGEEEKACEKNGTGRVSLENGYATQIDVGFNGVSYGAVNPGETGAIDLPSGAYTMSMDFVGGGVACTDLDVNVSECSKQGYVCEP